VNDTAKTPDNLEYASNRALRNEVFRRHESNDRRMLIVAVLLAGLVNFAFVIGDCRNFPASGSCLTMALMRGALFALALGFAGAIPFIRSIRWLQVSLLAWQILMSLGFTLVDWLIPPGSPQYSMGDLAYLIALFLFMPNRLLYQILSAAFFMAIHIVMLHHHGGFSPLWWESLLMFPVAMICSGYISWRIMQTRLSEYRRWSSERHARVALQSAVEQVKTLSGLLPICAYCKKVRDDSGYWHEVESYIRRHSTADFSHSLCPDCGEEHYPEFLSDEDFR